MKISLGLMLAGLLVAAGAQAGLVTFSDRSVVVNDASGSSVLTNGAHVVAGNVYGGLPDPVVNGVTFQQLGFSIPVSANYGVILSIYDIGGSVGYTDAAAAAYYSASADLAELMSKNMMGAYYSNGIGITVSNLTIGMEYQLQGFYWDKASGSIQYVSDANNVTSRSVTFETSTNAVGYSWTATWVADSTVQSIEVMPGPSSRALLTGVSLQVIPEPATFGLFAVFGAAALFIRTKFMI